MISISKLLTLMPISLVATALSALFLNIVRIFHNIWNGHLLLLCWILILCMMIETTTKYFRSAHRYEVDVLDVIVSVIIVCVISLLGASLCLDLIHENANSDIFVANDVLSPSVCNQIMYAAERHATDKGWLTHRHKNYPTTDIAVYSMKQNITVMSNINNLEVHNNRKDTKEIVFSLWIDETIDKEIFPRLVTYYGLNDVNLLSMQDLLSSKNNLFSWQTVNMWHIGLLFILCPYVFNLFILTFCFNEFTCIFSISNRQYLVNALKTDCKS